MFFLMAGAAGERLLKATLSAAFDGAFDPRQGGNSVGRPPQPTSDLPDRISGQTRMFALVQAATVHISKVFNKVGARAAAGSRRASTIWVAAQKQPDLLGPRQQDKR